jgi:DNA-binding transcriptional MerR regulator
MEDVAPAVNTYGLPIQPPRTLFRVLDGLRLAATVAEPSWSHLHPLPVAPPAWTHPRDAREHPAPFQSYYLYATAMKGLANWPDGFVTWLKAYRERGPIPRQGRLGTDLGIVYQTWIERAWQHPDFQFLQEVFDQYLVENYSAARSILKARRYRQNPDFAAQLPYVSMSEAARMLRVSPRTVGWLISTGRLRTEPKDDASSSSITFVQRSDVLALHERWQRSFSLDEAAQLLDLSPVVTVDLVKVGLLSAERGPSVGDTFQWRFTPQALESCVSRIAEHVRSSPQAVSAGANLVQAAQILASVGLNVSRILKRVADGQLSGYRATADDLRLGSICFAHNDLSHCIETIKAEHNWIARDDVLKHLGVKHTTLARWVAAGLITPVAIHANAHYFNREDVMTFWQRYIKSDVAATIVGVGRIAIQEWVREGRFGDACVSGVHLDGYHAYLFDRERLMAWRWSRLTVGETQRLLGVSKATVHRYVMEGKLKPLDNARGPHPHRWFARAEVEALHAERLASGQGGEGRRKMHLRA